VCVATVWGLQNSYAERRPPKCHIRACLSVRADV
jgi:hypothetical protein